MDFQSRFIEPAVLRDFLRARITIRKMRGNRVCALTLELAVDERRKFFARKFA
jgi:S-adenosylmethionine:diacylglycerol 3-amino-3-carboxypropyl transferase